MICKKCNQEISDEAKFCENCGASTEEKVWGKYAFLIGYLCCIAMMAFSLNFLFLGLLVVGIGTFIYRKSILLRVLFILTFVFSLFVIFLLIFWATAVVNAFSGLIYFFTILPD